MRVVFLKSIAATSLLFCTVQGTSQTVQMRDAQTQQMQDHQKLTPDEVTMYDDVINRRVGGMITLGWPVAPIFSLGLGGNYIISKTLWVEVIGSAGSESYSEQELLGRDDPDVIMDTKMTSVVFQGGGRFFLGETFNIRGGLAYRKIGFTIDAKSDLSVSTASVDVNAVSLAGYFSLGNTWIHDDGRWIIGCDWFGVMVPVTSNNGSSTTTTTGVPDETLNSLASEAEDSAKKLGDITTFSMLNLHIGMFF